MKYCINVEGHDAANSSLNYWFNEDFRTACWRVDKMRRIGIRASIITEDGKTVDPIFEIRQRKSMDREIPPD